MRYRILSVGTDLGLLQTRQAVLDACGYDSVIATLEDLDEKLRFGRFDLAILSGMLSEQQKRDIQAKLPAGTRPLALDTLVFRDQLLRLVAQALA
jgi:molybdenum cofactor biosynthesis enzyme MoaA